MTADPARAEAAAPAAASPGELARDLEAILFVVDEPQSPVALAGAVAAPPSAVEAALAELVADYDGHRGGPRRGFELREVGGRWRIYVREDRDELVAAYVNAQTPARLSQAALETLAVIAYTQPVTRSRVAAIRAVNVDSVVRTLVARGLVAEAEPDPETGATTYRTTDALLGHLGIDALDELPPLSPLLDDGADGFDGEVLR